MIKIHYMKNFFNKKERNWFGNRKEWKEMAEKKEEILHCSLEEEKEP